MEQTLNVKLSLIQKEFKAAKSKFNSFGKYNFRSAEDILEALKPFNEKYQVNFTITESIVESNFLQFPMLRSVASISDNLDTISASAIVGIDLDQKGMQMPQKFGSASSYGKKYALGNLFLIDDTQDADASNTHGKNTTTKSTIASSNDAAYTKAVEYIKGGGKLEAIKQKYELAPDVEVALQKL